jgi:hypothetical protein
VDELDGEVPAWIGQNNRLWAAAEMMSDDYELELIARSTTYDAVVEECPSGEMLTKITTEAATARAVTASITATTRRPLAIPVQPTSLCDGWLEYRYLNAGSPPLGHLLMLGSKPLQARVLAVAAFDVSWAFGLGQGRLVSRPMGLLAEDRGDWWYGEVPPAALVLTQGVLASREVVVSQSRETPDVFSFDARRFVFAKLNIPAATVSCHGAYSLWVKRIA